MTAVLIKDVSCYTAMEVIKGVRRPTFRGNVIGPNGNHRAKLMWSDGITIHDAIEAVVEDNVFKDNTDVQLILGGCRNCSIRNNKFYHSDNPSHAAFGELMLHAWPDTSGDFAGSRVTGNNIDCGLQRRCGYGIMIGGEPWYPSKASGGAVKGNSIKNALMGLNVDKLTGQMDIGNNRVTRSGRKNHSDCGVKIWPSVNISPDSKIFAFNKPKFYASVKTNRCLLGR